jgi:hypothetical protein
MKKVLLFTFAVLTSVMSFAQDEVEYPVITGLGNGKFIITVNAAGQINGLDLTSETYSALATATELRVVTEGTSQLSSDDMTKLCSNSFQFGTLDLENAKVADAGTNNDTHPFRKLNSAPESLKNIIFPVQDGMCIPDRCFQNNTKIESIIIPDYESGSYKIGSGAFSSSKIKRASIGKGTLSLGGDPTTTPNVYSEGQGCFQGCSDLYSLVLDKNIKCIKSESFQNCTSLEYVVLPDELNTIGSNAFAGCSAMKTVTIPAKMRNWGRAVFQGMTNLSDVYVLASDIPLPFGGSQDPIFVPEQTTNFKYEPAGGPGKPTYSQADYKPSNQGSQYIMAILHYPDTPEARANYRWEGANNYNLVDEDGTTWPDAKNVSDFWTYSSTLSNSDDQYKGWKYFMQGNVIGKTNDIYDITRFKESRWYSVCFPFDITVDKFQNAFGARAALSEFVGFTFDDESQKMTIHFDVAAIPNDNGVILKANHAYMIHPSKLVENDNNPIQIYDVNNLMEHYRTAEVLTRRQQAFDNYEAANTAYNNAVAEGKTGPDLEPFKKAKNDAEKIWNEWKKVKTDNTVEEENMNNNQKWWYDEINDKDESNEYRVRRYALPSQLQNDVTYYFRGNYIEKPTGERFAGSTLQDKKLPAGCYYLGGLTETFYHRKGEGSKWTPYTAILEAGSESTGDPTLAPVVNFVAEEVLNENGEQATGIDTKLFVTIPIIKTSNVYNMQGQKVSSNGIEGLPKGMYIMNGKKYVVK